MGKVETGNVGLDGRRLVLCMQHFDRISAAVRLSSVISIDIEQGGFFQRFEFYQQGIPFSHAWTRANHF